MIIKGKKHLRLLSVALALLLTAGTCPGTVFASQSGQEQLSGWDEITAQAAAHDDPFAPEEGYLMETRSDMPETFDLRHVHENGQEKCYVTPVRLQYPYGSCWGFGAIAAAETSILGSYPELKPDTLNLSEKQVTWFNANTINDPDNPQNGEGMVFDETATAQERYDVGGFTSYATGLFASGSGPVAETADTADGNVYMYKGRNGEVINDFVTWTDADGKAQSGFRKVWYSEDDDWTIADKYRFNQTYMIRESFLLPSPASFADEEKGPVIDAIKEQLLQKHAVAFNFCADSSKPGDEESQFGYIDLTNWAQYTAQNWPSNHVVTIIGYDDHYPKTNFRTDAPADGAWLVKNSWGSDLSEFPDNGYKHWGLLEGQDIPGSDYQPVSKKSTGYFWMSYYDKTMRNPEAYSFEKPSTGHIIDQHDYMPVMEYEEYATETENKTANIFTASGDQKLTDVSCFTATPGTTASFRIYLLDDHADTPEDGTCVYTSEPVTYPFGGYHRVTLPETDRIVLLKGQKYSVVVTQQTPSGKYSISFAESDGEELSRGFVWFKAVVNKGESFLYVDNEWNDLSDPEIRRLLKDGAEGKEIDNFSIKTYSVPADAMGGKLLVQTGSGKAASALEDKPGSKYRLITSIRGAKDELLVQPEITWTFSDPSVASVELKKGGSEGIVLFNQSGETVLTVDAGIYGKHEIPITVNKLRLIGAQLKDEDRMTVYTGQPYEPKPFNAYGETVTDDPNYDLKEGIDYVVSYENNVLCGRGDTVLTGIGDYGGKLTADFFSHLDFRILPARANITGITPGPGKLRVEFTPQKDSGISGYVLSWKETGSDSTESMKLGPDVVSASIPGLDAEKTYDVSLKAYVTVEEEETFDEETETWGGGPTDYFGEESEVVTSGKVLPGGPFDDVGEGDYFHDAVIWAVKKAITNGTSDSTFSPSAECTRAQAVTFLWRAYGSEKVTDTENPFTDVKESDFCYDAVLWAMKNDITKGLSESSFGPEEKCSRGQIVTFLWRAEGEPETTAPVSYTDVDSGSFCYEAVQWAVEKEVTQGTSKTAFSPSQFCTRGQIVTFLYRALAE